MKPETIRRIDSWVGRPLCAVLTCLRKMDYRRRREEPAKKILFIKMIEQGATVLAYGALKRAADLVGRENVYFWVFEENRAILDLLDVVPKANVLTIRAQRLDTFLVDTLLGLWRIRRARIDTTVDMEFFTRAPAILAFLTGARRRVGLHRFTSEGPYRGDLMTHRVGYNPYVHASKAYDLLVQTVQADPMETPMLKARPPETPTLPPRFEPGEEETGLVRARLQAAAGRVVERPIVLLNPNASDMLPLRKWPTDRFVALGKRLLDSNSDLTVVITGAPSEGEAGARIADAIGERAVSMAGKTTLRELIVLYTLADVMVTNDSGPAHFASLTELQTLVLYGPETPFLFGPLGPGAHPVMAGLACSPCVNVFNHRFSACTDNVCMQKLSVDDMFEKTAALLAECAPSSGEAE